MAVETTRAEDTRATMTGTTEAAVLDTETSVSSHPPHLPPHPHTNTHTVRPPFSGSGHILAGTAAPAARPALQLARRGEGDASGGGGGGSAAPKQRVDPFGGAKPTQVRQSTAMRAW
jgi:hypothetical protein